MLFALYLCLFCPHFAGLFCYYGNKHYAHVSYCYHAFLKVVYLSWLDRWEDKLKPIALGLFKIYFDDRSEKFDEFYDQLAVKDKEKFLRLSQFYEFYFQRLNQAPEHIQSNYGFIAFFCLVESLMSDKKFVSFENWLPKDMDFPIKIHNRRELESIKRRYYKEHGATKKARDFFHRFVDKEDQVLFLDKFGLSGHEDISWQHVSDSSWINREINKRISLVYKMRSDFVHQAKLIMLRTPGVSCTFARMGNQSAVLKLSSTYLGPLFMRGMLRFFGHKGFFFYPGYRQWIVDQRREGNITDEESIEAIEHLHGRPTLISSEPRNDD